MISPTNISLITVQILGGSLAVCYGKLLLTVFRDLSQISNVGSLAITGAVGVFCATVDFEEYRMQYNEIKNSTIENIKHLTPRASLTHDIADHDIAESIGHNAFGALLTGVIGLTAITSGFVFSCAENLLQSNLAKVCVKS